VEVCRCNIFTFDFSSTFAVYNYSVIIYIYYIILYTYVVKTVSYITVISKRCIYLILARGCIYVLYHTYRRTTFRSTGLPITRWLSSTSRPLGPNSAMCVRPTHPWALLPKTDFSITALGSRPSWPLGLSP